MDKKLKLIILSVIVITACLGFPRKALANYYATGTLISTNLLAGVGTVASIDSFWYNASSIPSGTSLKVQFSQDNSIWKNSFGTVDAWDDCTTTSGATISLSTLGWSGANFYYKMQFDSNVAQDATPVLEEIRVDYTLNLAPTAPTSLLTEGQTNPSGVTDTTPEFSAIYNDPNTGDIANKYRIQVDDDPAFGSALWDSGASGTSMTNCNQGNRCQDISYGGASTDLQWNTKYYWRIKYWDQFGLEGAWSTESAYFTMSPIYEPTSCMIDDSGQSTQLIIKWSDNTILETGYRIERSVDTGDWALLSTEAANSTSKTDETVSSDHTYLYRIRADSDNGNSQWCSTSQVDYHKGNLQMQGIIVK